MQQRRYLVAVPSCRECGAANPDEFRFCGECGARLDASSCPACGAPHLEEQRFCGQCGFALGQVTALTPAGPPEAVQERKLATVLFADVVGFTSLAERTDPEIVARMVDTAFREMGAVVVEHGGTVDKYMGDSLMAVFGVPVAHDDDAERAVAAALAMRKLGGDLMFSIGVNSGEVMATDIGRAGDATVIGDTVNVAARFEKAAGPGEVLCGALTAELAGSRVVFRPRQPVLLKGKREPVDVWEAVALRQGSDTSDGEQLPLVGRCDELDYLEALWQRVCRDGQAQVALLCGDAGSGKTRVAAELAGRIAVTGDVVRAAYPAYGPMGGVQLAGEVLRQLGPVDDVDVDVRAWSLAGRTAESLKGLDPTNLEKEQHWGFLRLLEKKSAERPLAIILDDMHRSAEGTLNLLGDLTIRIGQTPLLLVLVGRSEPSEWLARFPTATTVRLASLGRLEAAELAAALVCDKPLAPEAADFLVERAGGNPLYLRELVRVARAQGSLIDDGSRYLLGSSAAVPATLQALLAARLDALGPGQKRVFQYAAVLGHGTTADQIAELAANAPDEQLRFLVDAGLLRLGADGGYTTADPLLREVAYETLPRNIRGELHRRASSVVTVPEERARHLDRAAKYLGDDEEVVTEAAETLATVGEEFAAEYRLVDAERLLSRAVALGCRRQSALLALARIKEARADADGAAEILALVADDPDDPAVAVERDHALARAQLFSDPAWARPRFEAVAARWAELGRPVQEAWAIANAGVASFNQSRMEEAAHDLERALAMFEACDDRTGAVGASSFLCLARPTDRRVPGWLADALEFADEAGDRSKQTTALSPLAWHHFLRSLWGGPGDTMEAERFALRLAETSEGLGSTEMAIHGRSLLAVMARYGGRLQVAEAHATALARHLQAQHHNDPWLGWATSFVVAVAGGATQAAAPFPPLTSPDPVAGVAAMLIQTELLFTGRVDEVLEHFPQAPLVDGNPMSDKIGMLCALALVLAGRSGEARPWAQRANSAARTLESRAGIIATTALLAEIDGNPANLPPMPVVASSVAEMLVLRAHAVLGAPDAIGPLQRAADALIAPGLLAGIATS